MLAEHGASWHEAEQIIAVLEARMTPNEMHEWLAHPRKAHRVVDPEARADWGIDLMWTPVNAIAAGKSRLVLEAARRHSGG
jgi:hypothetical protein